MAEKLTDEQVRRVAMLSRLELRDDQVHGIAVQLSSVLEFVSKLSELDVDGVEPMAHARDVTNVLREDGDGEGLEVEQVLRNAPGASGVFFKVPKVLGDGSSA